jgi:hypothetical protein
MCPIDIFGCEKNEIYNDINYYTVITKAPSVGNRFRVDKTQDAN